MCQCNNGPFYYGCNCCRRYSFVDLLFDLFMTMITCGWWVVWWFWREVFRRNRC